jgi:hypothetical protein
MKSKILPAILILGMLTLIISSCGRMEKKIIGTWLIEDITIEGDTTLLNAQQHIDAIEEQKDLRFELKPDSLLSIYTGSVEIPGLWYYKRRGRQVYILLEGNTTPAPLGRYEKGKLVNRDTSNVGLIINTTFMKLEPVEEE